MWLMGYRIQSKYVVVMAFLFLLVFTGCTPSHHMSTFDTHGPVARSQLVLFYWIFWAAVFVFVTVSIALFYTVLKYRRRSGDPDPPQIHGHTKLEIAWTIIPSIILIVVAVPTVITIFDNANSPEPSALTIEAKGHQWWFEFTYPHPEEPDKKVVTANELHIPVDEVVNVNLESKDVIHSFWIPKIAGKVDMVPNHTNTIWIKADETGEYYGQCAEFCGVAHAKMKFRVIVQTKEQFEAWLKVQALPGLESADPLAVEGRNLFEGDARCWTCHKVEGSKRSRGTTGPNLTHFGSRNHLAAGVIENTQDNLRKWIQDPESIKQGTIMYRDAQVYTDPDKSLTESQVSALVAYLASLD